MKRRWLLGTGTVVALAVGVFAIRSALGRPVAYASLRQVREQDVPGTFGLTIAPPPDDLRPGITPERAARIGAPLAPAANVTETLAMVPSRFVTENPTSAAAPAWVVIVRGLCYASAKGELVSGSRGTTGADPSPHCSNHNIWIAMIDPSSGRRIGAVSGYDDSGMWTPATGGSA